MRKPLSLLAILLFLISCAGAIFAGAVEITAPPNGASIKGDQVDIVVNIVTSADKGVTRIDVSLDGTKVTKREYSPAMTGGDSVFRWDTTRNTNGKHLLGIEAFAGTVSLGKAACEVSISNKDGSSLTPKIRLKGLRNEQVVSGMTPIIVEASDSGIDPLVTIMVDESIRSISNVPPYIYDWNTTTVANGPHIIAAEVSTDSDKSQFTRVKVIVKNSNKQILALKPTKPELPSLPTHSDDEDKPATKTVSTATPMTARGAAKTEVGRTDSLPSATGEQFEVAQLQKQRPLGSTVSHPVQKPVLMASAEVPQTATVSVSESQLSTPPTQSSVETTIFVANGVASNPVTTPSLISKLKDPEVATTAKTESVLLAPSVPNSKPVAQAAPKPAAVAPRVMPNGSASAPVTSPSLSVTSATISSSVKRNNILALPPMPAAETEVIRPQGVESKPMEKPVLIARLDSVDMTTAGNIQNQISAPPMPKPVTATHKAVVAAVKPRVAINGSIFSRPSETPQVFIARAETGQESAITVKTDNKPVAPAMPKAKKVMKASKPAMVCTAADVKQTPKQSAPKKAKTACAQCKPTSKKMVRLRGVFEGAGGSIDWNRKARTAHATASDKDVQVKIGSKKAVVNSKSVKMDRAAAIRKGRTVVPESFVTDTLGMTAK